MSCPFIDKTDKKIERLGEDCELIESIISECSGNVDYSFDPKIRTDYARYSHTIDKLEYRKLRHIERHKCQPYQRFWG